MLIWVETVLLRCTNINQKKPGLGQKSRKTMRQHSTNTRRAHQLIPSNPSADGLDASVLLKTPHQGKHTNSDIVCLTFANAVMSRLTDNITYSPHRHFITRSSNWSWWPHTCANNNMWENNCSILSTSLFCIILTLTVIFGSVTKHLSGLSMWSYTAISDLELKSL